MKRIFLVSSIALAAFSFVLSSCTNTSEKTKTIEPQEQVKYQCPMDCESGKTYDKPGKCPVCEMDLEKKVEV